MRIVSLLPSATEIICELGLGAALVGVTHECDHPAEVRGLPRVTRTLIPTDASSREIDDLVRDRLRSNSALYELDLPVLERLAPDLIVTQALCDVCAVAEAEVAACADRLVHFAGWADKISAVFGSVNQVATSHFNFTVPEPTGVVAVLAPDRPSALGLIGAVAPVLVAGNTVVVVASDAFPLAAMELAEAFATSDLPAGVVNILTGKRAELVGTMASHLDINAVVDASDDPAHRTTLRLGVAGNLKRVHFRNATREAGTDILDTVEMKTVWHPVSW